MELKERFLKYVSYDTQSSEESATFPSTEKQKVLLGVLRDEMEALGMTEVTMDRYGYVMGTIPATPGCGNAPVIGFIAHVDTSPDMSGKDVKPRVIEEYDGCDIALNGQLTMRVADFPELEFFKGHTLIHTDGTTLLGADENSGDHLVGVAGADANRLPLRAPTRDRSAHLRGDERAHLLILDLVDAQRGRGSLRAQERHVRRTRAGRRGLERC